jgi:hypothetical protein
MAIARDRLQVVAGPLQLVRLDPDRDSPLESSLEYVTDFLGALP